MNIRTDHKVSDEYSTGRLHITTRQDINHVSLDRTPDMGTISNR
jgi:dissimilatory sulfite reductase (desulfoviridin) alpha/beta subunit